MNKWMLVPAGAVVISLLACGFLNKSFELEITNPLGEEVEVMSNMFEPKRLGPGEVKTVDVEVADEVSLGYETLDGEVNFPVAVFNPKKDERRTWDVGATEVPLRSQGQGSKGSYEYTWTCPDTGDSGSAPIPRGKCESEFERYSRVFGCNQIGEFRSACLELYTCLGSGAEICEAYE